jgi:hypothetical protein
MPLLRPEVARLLEEAKLTSKGKSSRDIKEVLEDEGLGLADTLGKLKDLRDFSESESTKLRVNEAILKMHGVMKEEGATIPNVTIVIGDAIAGAANPILLPRELHKIKENETIQ